LRINWKRGLVALAVVTAFAGGGTACDPNLPPGGIHISGSGDVRPGDATSAAPTSSSSSSDANDSANGNGSNQQADNNQSSDSDSGHKPKTYDETVAYAPGIPLFNDNRGTISGGLDGDATVQVVCYEDNQSGYASINVFYVIYGGPNHGKRASANSFWNGGGKGSSSVDLDPNVPPCSHVQYVPEVNDGKG
jgi:hypothetical protein